MAYDRPQASSGRSTSAATTASTAIDPAYGSGRPGDHRVAVASTEPARPRLRPAADVFYVGGWNARLVYRVPTRLTDPAHPIVAGTAEPDHRQLASNETFGDCSWAADGSRHRHDLPDRPDDLIETTSGAASRRRRLRRRRHRARRVGNVWTVGQNLVNAYLVEYDLPTFSDVAVADREPDRGHRGDRRQPGHRRSRSTRPASRPASIGRSSRIQTERSRTTPLLQVPVTLVVPTYQQGVNAGGNAYVDPTTGDLYATDRAFSAGGFGYVGEHGSIRRTAAIAGTDRDPLYQDLREGMSAYRFAVPNGVYKVDLSFAELQLKKAGARVFSVSLEGTAVVSNLDVVRRRRRPAHRLRPVVHRRGHRRRPRHRVPSPSAATSRSSTRSS